MKKLLCVLLMGVYTLGVQAEPQFTHQPFNYSVKGSFELFLLPDNSTIAWSQKERKGESVMETLTNFKVSGTGKINLTFKGEEVEIVNRSVIDGSLYFFFSTTTKEKIRTYYVSKVDKNTYKFESSAVKIFSRSVERKSPFYSLNMAISPDRQLFMVSYPTYNSDFSEVDWTTNVYNTNLKVIAEHERPKNTYEEMTILANYGITNEGTIYWLTYKAGKKTEGRRAKGYIESVYLNTIYRGRNYSEKVEIGDLNLYSGSSIVKNNVLTVSGGSLNPLKSGGINGVYHMSFNLKNAILLSKNNLVFSDKILATEFSDKKIEKSKNKDNEKGLGLQFYSLTDFMMDKDGNSYGVFEKRQVFERTTNSKTGVTTTTYTYVYSNLLVYGFDSDGANLFVQSVPKVQLSHNDRGNSISHFAGLQNGKLYLLFKDAVKNYSKGNGNFITPKKNPVRFVKKGTYAYIEMNPMSGAQVRKKLDIETNHAFNSAREIKQKANDNLYYFVKKVKKANHYVSFSL